MQTLSVDQLVGRTLGEYRIERLLGQGQLGAAYLAQQLLQGRTVMLTLFNFPEGMSAQEGNQCATRFAQERATLTRLTHPNILPIYDCGEHAGYLYLVTAFVKGTSLAQVLQHQGRFTPQQTLAVLKQVAAGLDYAHSQGAVHGLLSLSTVLLSDGITVQLAGFGLRTLLEVHGNIQNRHPQAHLLSANGIFLGSPASISPERVLGMPTDARSDIYALGVMLFELLSGTLPFRGVTPLDMALQRLQQPVPSVHAVCQDVPEVFDLVLSKTLERDPAKRYQRAGSSAAAFERVLTLLEAAQRATDSSAQQLARDPQISLPPTVNRYEEAGIPSGKWQLLPLPLMVTAPLPAVTPSPSFQNTARAGAATPPDTPADTLPMKAVLPSPVERNPDSLAGVEPFARWKASPVRPETPPPASGTFTQQAPAHPARSTPRSYRRPAQQERRKLVMLIAAGTAAVVVGEIGFAHLVQSMKRSPAQIATVPAAGSTSAATPTGKTPAPGSAQGIQTTSTPSKSPTAKPSPTKVPQPSPTSQPTGQPTPRPTPTQPPTPTPTPTPPSHTGTVIGSTSQATNSAVSFTNPADGQGSLLLHLSNGNFVACERACTHARVPVNYDPGSGQLVCPAHGAIFDPLHGFSHVSGPGKGPLATVSIRVNADGTITTG